MLAKSPKESLQGNSVKSKLYFLLLHDLLFCDVYSHISMSILLISNFNRPFKSSHNDESFGTKIITLGPCIEEL